MTRGGEDVLFFRQNHPPLPLATIDATGVLVQNALAPLTSRIAI